MGGYYAANVPWRVNLPPRAVFPAVIFYFFVCLHHEEKDKLRGRLVCLRRRFGSNTSSSPLAILAIRDCCKLEPSHMQI